MNNLTRASLKALLLLAVLCFRSNIMLAQTEQVTPQGLVQGRWLVGGSLGGANFAFNEQQSIVIGGSTSTRIFSSINVNAGTTLGFLVAQNVVIGGSLGMNYGIAGGENFAGANSGLGVGVGPFARYYFANVGSHAALFGGVAVQYALSLESFFPGSQLTLHNITPTLTLGSTWFVSRDVALELLVNYDRRFFLGVDNRLTAASGFPILYTAPSSNTGALRLNIGFQIFLDKVF
ncbi:MAG: hypothetical protein MUF71_10405 [Candidatus Kapabacteria bacterium]|jgi:hypothetical protein|nr:hypothetical protein [Candidatus Kapabacteria bacterium]